MATTTKRQKQIRRHARVRAKAIGNASRPRLSVFRSNQHIYAQLIDDAAGNTLVAANDVELKGKKGAKEKKIVFAERVGEMLAERALQKNIKNVIFDRSGYRFHGMIKAIAEGARKKGLLF